jgi:hypothetical protein
LKLLSLFSWAIRMPQTPQYRPQGAANSFLSSTDYLLDSALLDWPSPEPCTKHPGRFLLLWGFLNKRSGCTVDHSLWIKALHRPHLVDSRAVEACLG